MNDENHVDILKALQIRKVLDDSDILAKFYELLCDVLYSEVTYTDREFKALENGIIIDNISIDLYCRTCERESVFEGPRLQKDIHEDAIPGPLQELHGFKSKESAEARKLAVDYFSNLLLRCARNKQHTVRIILQVTPYLAGHDENNYPIINQKLRKIGQYPSYTDIQKPTYAHLEKHLDKIDHVELNKAIGLASHDSTIGAFVYLRRVFERLIEKAHADAKKDKEWNEEQFVKSRMDEKVALLADHLPGLLVENKKIYGVLSVGIHSLTEDLCKSVFDPVRDGIYLMLEDTHSKKQHITLRQNLGPSLTKVQEKIDAALSENGSEQH